VRIWEGLESIGAPFGESSVAIGMFDGVHVGHQALIHACVADARAHARPSVVFTFDRHPAELIAPDHVPGYLTTPTQRAELIRALGPDHLVIARFDTALRALSPESFVQHILKDLLGAKALMVGKDFRFGRNQAGDVAFLRTAQKRFGFTTTVLEPVRVHGEKASSTRIRQLLRSGDLPGAQAALGHPYVLAGTVVEGEKLGRRLGYPTVNLKLTVAQVLPADGVYAVWVQWPGQKHKGACSIGTRPTVDGKRLVVETYLLDFDSDLYGATISLEFVARLRDQIRFDTLDALAIQMARDVAQARAILSEG
jgi:riboflavin kinase/FMN adenylyltransferase